MTDLRHRIDALLLERWDRDPNLPALIAGETVVRTGELKDRVLRTAAALRAHGVGPSDRVVVHHERSVEFVVATLGVAFAGGAHVAVDTNDPGPRVHATVRDCAPKAILTNSRLRSRFSALNDTAVLTPEECVPSPPAPAKPAHGSPDDPVTLLYTSGSTGSPKASLISHRALASRVRALQATHHLDAHDRMAHHTACTFDGHLCEIYWPLLAGATVVLAEPGRQRDADHLAALIHDHAITTLYCVVSLLDLFLLARDSAERYDGLRQVLTGGEPLSPGLVARFHARSTASLTNLYGPSECTIHCTTWVCPRDPDPQTVLIGSAVQDTALWVLDRTGEPVPDGDPGELYIGGAGLALGYLNRPDLTAERFVTTPYGRLYRSGDLVRVAGGDGALEFLGRVDRQVNVRGVRVEPGEIESTATHCQGVGQVAVVAHGAGADQALAAFLVREAGMPPPTDLSASVRAYLRDRLPTYLVPRTIDLLEAMPLTANGKLDRARLEEWAAAAAATAAPEPPSSATVDPPDLPTLVREVWREALGITRTMPEDDFFDVGGNSVKVVHVVRTLRERLSLHIPLSALLENPTLESFTEALVNETRRDSP